MPRKLAQKFVPQLMRQITQNFPDRPP
jgi:hypothetical protein